MSKPARREPCAFAMLVYQLLVVEKVATVGAVASSLGMTYAAFHSRLNNRTRFSPSEARALVRRLEEARLLHYFAEESRFIIAERPGVSDDGSSIRVAVAKAVREAVDVMQVAVESLETGAFVDHVEKGLILKEVQDAESAMASLRLALERRSHPPGVVAGR